MKGIRCSQKSPLMKSAVVLCQGSKQLLRCRKPDKSSHMTFQLELVDQLPKTRSTKTPLAKASVEGGSSLQASMNAAGNILAGAEGSYRLKSRIFQIKPDQIACVTINHGEQSAFVSSRISSIPFSPGPGRNAPLSISFLKPGRNWRREK